MTQTQMTSSDAGVQCCHFTFIVKHGAQCCRGIRHVSLCLLKDTETSQAICADKPLRKGGADWNGPLLHLSEPHKHIDMKLKIHFRFEYQALILCDLLTSLLSAQHSWWLISITISLPTSVPASTKASKVTFKKNLYKVYNLTNVHHNL